MRNVRSARALGREAQHLSAHAKAKWRAAPRASAYPVPGGQRPCERARWRRSAKLMTVAPRGAWVGQADCASGAPASAQVLLLPVAGSAPGAGAIARAEAAGRPGQAGEP